MAVAAPGAGCQYPPPPPEKGLEAGAAVSDTVTSCHTPPEALMPLQLDVVAYRARTSKG